MRSIIELTIWFVLVLNEPNSINPTDAAYIWGKTRRVLETEFPGTRLSVVREKVFVPPRNAAGWPIDITLGPRTNELQAWRRYLEGNKKLANPKTLRMVLAPPLVDKNGINYIGGIAYTKCGLNRTNSLAVTNILSKSFTGLERKTHSAYAVLHELLHTLDAQHDENRPGSVMHPSALQYLDEGSQFPLRITAYTRNQVMSCLRTAAKRAKQDRLSKK